MPYFNRNQTIEKTEYLYSTVGNQFDTYTLSANEVKSVDDQNNKYIQKGVLLALITSGDNANKVAPYDSSATDGRQTAANFVGYNDTFGSLAGGDIDVGVLYRGTVDKTKVTVDGSVGDPAPEIKAALRTASIDILHR